MPHLDRRAPFVPVGGGFVGVRHAEQRRFVHRLAVETDRDRQSRGAGRKAAGHDDFGNPGHASEHGIAGSIGRGDGAGLDRALGRFRWFDFSRQTGVAGHGHYVTLGEDVVHFLH